VGGRKPSRPLNSLFSISHSAPLVKGIFFHNLKKLPAPMTANRIMGQACLLYGRQNYPVLL
jgi:hypothetical protein